MMIGLCGRLAYLMLFDAEDYAGKAVRLHERERDIKAARGRIVDAARRGAGRQPAGVYRFCDPQSGKGSRGGYPHADGKSGDGRGRHPQKSGKGQFRELIRSNVDKETGDRIRAFHYEGVKVDEDYQAVLSAGGAWPPKVLGFTGSDNQGIIGLEVAYESYLKGTAGQIRTLTDARGVEIENAAEARTEPVPGYDPVRQPGQQHPGLRSAGGREGHGRKTGRTVSVLLMNPQNGKSMPW